ncbi:PLP-dependent aminotransferase family protein [Sphaerisporangium sp. TRM90804]|uniref:aminotransferase-like domain-containing protein n=1 Tax=Sphaerisporangium sp. TRM90804 TaxID=3031113 RepID=UPI002446BDD8|nr:PLP-dependent aminotransferase family protein [Sphaerisporangium sp. TRM90804]MDH2424508.1 PLP-dependent aminotransferase family protein [Sphaerisporangium sp. TRM90804]
MRHPEPLNLPVMLDPGSRTPYREQLERQIRGAIRGGALEPGDRLPSTRVFAEVLGISRSVTLAAFDDLLRSGVLESRPGSGTYVAGPAAPAHGGPRPGSPAAEPGRGAPAAAQRDRAPREAPRRLVPVAEPRRARPVTDLRPGQSSLGSFPVRAWRSVCHQASHRPTPPAEFVATGSAELRREICRYLRGSRGLVCSPEEVIVTWSAEHAVDVLARSVLPPGTVVAVEEPGPIRLDRSLTGRGARLFPVPADELGVLPEELPGDAACAVLSPRHQMPLGGTLPMARRLAAVRWRRRTGAVLVEVDDGAEFGQNGTPMPALYSLDPDGRTVYVGSFEGLFAPELRLGYLVAGRWPAGAVRRLLDETGESVPALVQSTMTELLRSGQAARHVRRTGARIRAARRVIGEVVADRLPSVRLLGTGAGAHAVLRLPDGADDVALAARLRSAGVRVATLADYHRLPGPRRTGLVIGYAHLDEHALRAALATIAGVIATGER